MYSHSTSQSFKSRMGLTVASLQFGSIDKTWLSILVLGESIFVCM